MLPAPLHRFGTNIFVILCYRKKALAIQVSLALQREDWTDDSRNTRNMKYITFDRENHLTKIAISLICIALLLHVFLKHISFTYATLWSKDLTGTKWRGVQCVNRDLRGLNLSNTSFYQADLRGCNLRGATLAGAHFSFADLSGADLQNVNLTNADLDFCQLRNTNMRYAELSNASLEGAQIFGTDLINARLSNCKLKGSYYDPSTKWTKGFDPTVHGAVFQSQPFKDYGPVIPNLWYRLRR